MKGYVRILDLASWRHCPAIVSMKENYLCIRLSLVRNPFSDAKEIGLISRTIVAQFANVWKSNSSFRLFIRQSPNGDQLILSA